MVCPIVQSGRFPVVAFDLTRNLVAYWTLDEASGNAVDEVSGHTLTNVGTMTYVPGKLNNGATPDGGAKYLSMTTPSQLKTLGNGFSISMWVKPASITGSQRFVSNINGMSNAYCQMSSNGVWFVVAGTSVGFIAAGAFFTIGTWYHLVFVYDPSQIGVAMLRVYVNTVIDFQTNSGQPVPQSISSGSSDLNLCSVGGSSNMNGVLDEVGIWSRPLTPQEIWVLYGEGIPPAHPFTAFNSSTIKLLDNFDDTNNTLLNAHTPAPTNPDGLSWSSLVGTCQFKIVGNVLTMPATTKQILTIDPGTTDFTLTYYGNIGTGQVYLAIAILFRVVDENNYLWWHIKYTGECNLLERTAGTYSTVAGTVGSKSWPANDSTDHWFVLKQRGDKITTYIDGVKKWEYTTSQFTGVTKIGLAQQLEGSASAGAVCKSLEIRTGEQFPPYPLGIQ